MATVRRTSIVALTIEAAGLPLAILSPRIRRTVLSEARSQVPPIAHLGPARN
jgi:hypothetical protein